MRLQRPLALLVLAFAVTLACAQLHPHAALNPQAVADPLDINIATPKQLNALPGFGPAYTRRVIAGRPYTAKNQLATRGVIPQGAYERISALIIAHRSATAHPLQRPRIPHLPIPPS